MSARRVQVLFLIALLGVLALLGVVEAFRQSQIDVAGSFNYTPYICTAILFLLITIPLTRFTDWLIARDRRRQLAGGMT